MAAELVEFKMYQGLTGKLQIIRPILLTNVPHLSILNTDASIAEVNLKLYSRFSCIL
jgi:hypothetical protein